MKAKRWGFLLGVVCLAPILAVCNEKTNVDAKPIPEASTGAPNASASDAGASDAASDAASEAGSSFNLCTGSYALCTTAKCTPNPPPPDGGAPTLSCKCTSWYGPSAGGT